jgi:hypothetical protein
MRARVWVLRNALELCAARSPERVFNALRTASVLALPFRPVSRMSFGLALRVAFRLALTWVLVPTEFGVLGVATVRLPRPVVRLEARLALLRAVGRADERDAVEREIAALLRGPALARDAAAWGALAWGALARGVAARGAAARGAGALARGAAACGAAAPAFFALSA